MATSYHQPDRDMMHISIRTSRKISLCQWHHRVAGNPPFLEPELGKSGQVTQIEPRLIPGGSSRFDDGEHLIIHMVVSQNLGVPQTIDDLQ